MSPGPSPRLELPGKLEKILAALAGYYKRKSKPLIRSLLVNSSYRVHEEWSYDNWDGGTYGHAVYLDVPADVYFEVMDDLEAITEDVKKNMNCVANVRNEFVDELFIEMQEGPSIETWREDSGVLVRPDSVGASGSEKRVRQLWKPGFFRLFLSHKAAHKKYAGELKEKLDLRGVSCFVAHEDIEPTREWQDEIEIALHSMHALAALMTKGFSDSPWTDQEIGVAIGRGVPVIPIRSGLDPYGFIGKFQAVAGRGKAAGKLAGELYEVLWALPMQKERLTEALVTRFEKAWNFAEANMLMDLIADKIERTSPALIERLENARRDNGQVREAFNVRDRLPGFLKRLRKATDASS